jgi:hypothetical protein
MKQQHYDSLKAAKRKLEYLLRPGNNDGLYWQYMDMLAVNNVIASVLSEVKDDLNLKPVEVKK